MRFSKRSPGGLDLAEKPGSATRRTGVYGFTVSAALFVTPLTVTRIDGVTAAVTGMVRTVNVAWVAAAANSTDPVAGVAADGMVLASAALMPPEGAAHSIVASPDEDAPPLTVDGVSVTAVRKIGLTASGSDFATPPNVAVTLPVERAWTASPLTVTLALIAPGATTTVAGMWAPDVVEDSWTLAPPAGAAPVSVTLAVAV